MAPNQVPSAFPIALPTVLGDTLFLDLKVAETTPNSTQAPAPRNLLKGFVSGISKPMVW